MRKFAAVMIAALSSVCMWGQNLGNAEKRHINAKVLYLLENYEQFASVPDADARYSFLELFVGADAPVFCDIMGTKGYLSDIRAEDYADCLASNSSTTEIEIRNVVKGKPEFSGGKWNIPVTFSKVVNYTDGNGVLFSVLEYYEGKCFNERMNIVYDPKSDDCRILSIKGNLDARKIFPSGRFLVVNKKSPADTTVLFGKEKLRFNSFDQAIIAGGIPFHRDDDVRVKSDTIVRSSNYNIIEFRHLPLNWRVKLHAGIAPLSAYRHRLTAAVEDVSDKSSAFEIRADLGGTFRVGKYSKMGFFIGFGVSNSSLSLSLNKEIPYKISGISLIKPDADAVQHGTIEYKIKSASEGLKFTDLVTPVYVSFEHRLHKTVTLAWDVGAKFYMNFRTEVLPYTVSYSRDDDVNGLKDFEPKVFDGFLHPVNYKRNFGDITVAANLALDFNVYGGMLYISAGAGYEYGITDSYSYKSAENKWYDGKSNVYPVVPSVSEGQQQIDVAVRSFFDCIISYKRQALWMNLGVKFRF